MASDLRELLERTAAHPTRPVDPGVIVRRARQADRRRAAGSVALIVVAAALLVGLGTLLPERRTTETLFSPNPPTARPTTPADPDEAAELEREINETMRLGQERLNELQQQVRALQELQAEEQRELGELQQQHRRVQEELDRLVQEELDRLQEHARALARCLELVRRPDDATFGTSHRSEPAGFRAGSRA